MNSLQDAIQSLPFPSSDGSRHQGVAGMDLAEAGQQGSPVV